MLLHHHGPIYLTSNLTLKIFPKNPWLPQLLDPKAHQCRWILNLTGFVGSVGSAWDGWIRVQVLSKGPSNPPAVRLVVGNPAMKWVCHSSAFQKKLETLFKDLFMFVWGHGPHFGPLPTSLAVDQEMPRFQDLVSWFAEFWCTCFGRMLATRWLSSVQTCPCLSFGPGSHRWSHGWFPHLGSTSYEGQNPSFELLRLVMHKRRRWRRTGGSRNGEITWLHLIVLQIVRQTDDCNPRAVQMISLYPCILWYLLISQRFIQTHTHIYIYIYCTCLPLCGNDTFFIWNINITLVTSSLQSWVIITYIYIWLWNCDRRLPLPPAGCGVPEGPEETPWELVSSEKQSYQIRWNFHEKSEQNITRM